VINLDTSVALAHLLAEDRRRVTAARRLGIAIAAF